jgi:inner membrane protein
MPSPIGHALAGLAVAWAADAVPPQQDRGGHQGLHNAYLCATLAALPDADLLLPIAHRTVTHSFAAVAAVALLMIVASRVTGKVTRRVAIACVAAYASHLLLDWLQADPTPPLGIQAFWPASSAWFISGWDLFRPTERRHLFELDTLWRNVAAVVQETVILGSVAAAAWLIRVKALARLPPELARGDHPAE